MTKDKCFVIMPFGIKPIPDEPNKSFDFDKVYRTIIRRAVDEAGMEAIRADEQSGSHIIHSEMFRELRDRAVVLADLSLGNPNVYYELGIRHVLSAGGTVLMCREGTDLPFDIRLSRVIFYRFNGTDIDWEVVEDVVLRLRDSLLNAIERRPDSPVHALLENVYPENKKLNNNVSYATNTFEGSKTEYTVNQEFEKIVAQHWVENKEDIDKLIEQFKNNLFGMRALGELCLQTDSKGEQIFEIAKHLYFLMQYDLSYRIIKNLEDNPRSYRFTPDNYIKYGSVVSEREQTAKAATEGLLLMKKGLEIAENASEMIKNTEPYLIFNLYNSIGGLYRWKWQITKSEKDLNEAIENLHRAIEVSNEIESKENRPVGRIAQLHLRLLVLKRIKSNSTDGYDREGHLSTVLKLDGSVAMDEREASYLRWYKIIAHADAGNERKVREGTINAIQKDALLNHPEIGGAQYLMLRRFIENNLLFLRNHTLLGLISQDLQYSSKTGRID
jgi:hypothetical protein